MPHIRIESPPVAGEYVGLTHSKDTKVFVDDKLLNDVRTVRVTYDVHNVVVADLTLFATENLNLEGDFYLSVAVFSPGPEFEIVEHWTDPVHRVYTCRRIDKQATAKVE